MPTASAIAVERHVFHQQPVHRVHAQMRTRGDQFGDAGVGARSSRIRRPCRSLTPAARRRHAGYRHWPIVFSPGADIGLRCRLWWSCVSGQPVTSRRRSAAPWHEWLACGLTCSDVAFSASKIGLAGNALTMSTTTPIRMPVHPTPRWLHGFTAGLRCETDNPPLKRFQERNRRAEIDIEYLADPNNGTLCFLHVLDQPINFRLLRHRRVVVAVFRAVLQSKIAGAPRRDCEKVICGSSRQPLAAAVTGGPPEANPGRSERISNLRPLRPEHTQIELNWLVLLAIFIT